MHWNLELGKASWNLVLAADKVDLVLEGAKLGGDLNLGKELELGKGSEVLVLEGVKLLDET